MFVSWGVRVCVCGGVRELKSGGLVPDMNFLYLFYNFFGGVCVDLSDF
jgi:hypothetical protein